MINNIPVDRKNEIEVVKDTLGYTVGKNLLENTATTTTISGVTCTVNDDGSVTLNGTATGNHVNFSIKENFYLPNGEYILSGCPKGGSTNTYYFCLYDGETLCKDIGEGGTFVANGNMLQFVRIVIVSGQKVENLTFYPMIRKADVTDDTYEKCTGLSVDTRLNDVDTRLNSKVDTEWKLHQTLTVSNGTHPKGSLPASFNEILLLHRNSNNNAYIPYTFRYYMTKTELDIRLKDISSSNSITVGEYYTSSWHALWCIFGDKTIQLTSAMYSGNGSSSTFYQNGSVTYIYYR